MRFNFSISDSTKHFTIVGFGIVEVDRKILLLQNGSKKYHGRWTLPGQELQTNDRLDRSVEQGLRSAVNLTSKVDSLVGVYHSYDETADKGIMVFAYSMKAPSGTMKLSNSELLNAEWFHYNEIFGMPEESLQLASIQQIIRDYRRGRRFQSGLVRSV